LEEGTKMMKIIIFSLFVLILVSGGCHSNGHRLIKAFHHALQHNDEHKTFEHKIELSE